MPQPLPTPVKSSEKPRLFDRLPDMVSLRGGAGFTGFACIVLIVISVAFIQFPAIDLAVSELFFTPGSGFALAGEGHLQALRIVSDALTLGIAVFAVLALFSRAVLPRLANAIRPSHSVFLLSTLAAGPGIVVNGILKNYWGRARPRQTLEFGGDLPFTPAWANVDHCSGNCSFVSGEGSAAFWLVALAFITPRPLRLPVLVAALTFAAAVSVNRIAFGAHYLSDIIIAWAVTLVVVAIGRWIFLDRQRARTIDSVFAGPVSAENLKAAAMPKQDSRKSD